MAGSLNKVQLIGNVGRDPELKYLASGEAVTTFSVATNRRWRGQDGQTHEQTEWHAVVAWRTLAEQLVLLDSRTARADADAALAEAEPDAVAV